MDAIDQPEALNRFTLSDRPASLKWAVTILASLAFVGLLELIHLPAAILVGAMAAAVLTSAYEGRVAVPAGIFVFAQALIGCLIARGIGPGILMAMLGQWPIFLIGITAVLIISTTIGTLLARWRVLPGTTAIWGSAPGAATVMVLMAEAFGGDVRLVAFMQYLRVATVALLASAIAHLWMAPGGAAPPRPDWFPPVQAVPFAETMALAAIGAAAGVKSKIPAGGLLIPLFAGIALSSTHIVTIDLPPWLMAGCYVVVGWSIGGRFTRAIVIYAARVFPRIIASIALLIAACGALAYGLHSIAGIDPLTAYLATSPGGADSVAIIAASSKVDVSFVMAMQTARFMLVLLIGPRLARIAARWIESCKD
jgi:membrane AbrB-like protein